MIFTWNIQILYNNRSVSRLLRWARLARYWFTNFRSANTFGLANERTDHVPSIKTRHFRPNVRFHYFLLLQFENGHAYVHAIAPRALLFCLRVITLQPCCRRQVQRLGKCTYINWHVVVCGAYVWFCYPAVAPIFPALGLCMIVTAAGHKFNNKIFHAGQLGVRRDVRAANVRQPSVKGKPLHQTILIRCAREKYNTEDNTIRIRVSHVINALANG